MSISKFETLKQGSTINVNISVDIYYRINQLILYGFPFKDKDDFAKTLEIIQKNAEDTPSSYHMKTLLALQMEIEKSAREQNLIEELTKEELEEKFNFEPLNQSKES